MSKGSEGSKSMMGGGLSAAGSGWFQQLRREGKARGTHNDGGRSEEHAQNGIGNREEEER